ncbi:MAG: hypothetical protein K6E50_12570 [Lachnospiraceae bacterium]|nr:hypothetical protein [Lachnospiraceae bacterium]
MAKIVDFKARSFKLSEDCEGGCGKRLIVTENGENVECFEVAENGKATEIECELDLEQEQDYVFRFALKSRFIRPDAAESQVVIFFDEPDDGYTYPIDRGDRNRFKPVICKKTEEGILRVFELPFNSADSDSCTIRFRAHDMKAWVYPVKDAEAYAELPDVDYEQWRQDEIHKLAKKLNDLGDSLGGTLNELGGTIGENLKGIGEFVGEVGGKITKAVSDVIRPAASAEDKAEQVADETAGESDGDADKSDRIVINGPEDDKAE